MDGLARVALLNEGAVVDTSLPEADLAWWLALRKGADWLALALHTTFIVLAAETAGFGDAPELQLLLAMSAITLTFHILYLTGITDTWAVFGRELGPFTFGQRDRNTLKWAEYSITATLGTVAVAYSNSCDPDYTPPPTPIVYFLIAVAVTEQTTGYTWDSIYNFKSSANDETQVATAVRAFATTVLCQIGEFWVLSLYKSPRSAPWIVYVIGWSLFGLWALFRNPPWMSWSLDDGANRVQLSELGYALFSTAAKIGLFAAILYSKDDWDTCGAAATTTAPPSAV